VRVARMINARRQHEKQTAPVLKKAS
jgi:hypothetical protein